MVHPRKPPRKPKGGRSTDPDDYPPERTTYAMRAPDRVVRQAVAFGPHIGQFAERLASTWSMSVVSSASWCSPWNTKPTATTS